MSQYPNIIAVGGKPDYVFVSEVGTHFTYRQSGQPATDIYFDTSDNKWYDGSESGQPTAFWNKTVNPTGISDGNNPSIACSPGHQIQLLQAPGQGNLGTFTHPTITKSPGTLTVTTWGTQTGRQGYVSFGNNSTGSITYTVIDADTYTSQHNWVTHDQITLVAGENTPTGGWQYKLGTDVGALQGTPNTIHLLKSTGGYQGSGFTPTGHYPYLVGSGTSWPANASSGNFTVTYDATPASIYKDTNDGDKIAIVDSDYATNGKIYAEQMIPVNGLGTISTGQINDAFTNTEYNAKTFKLYIRNNTDGIGSNTLHEFGTSVGNAVMSQQYDSPYSAPAYSISNPVWAPQNGNVISVSWTETNPPPATGVELWKTNGTSAISSSTTGGPLSYTLQSTSDNGTYELKYNGNVVQSSTSGTFNYQSSGSLSIYNFNWTDDLWNNGTTLSCTFTAVNTTASGLNVYLKRQHVSGYKDHLAIPANWSGSVTLTDAYTPTGVTYYIDHSNSTAPESSYVSGSTSNPNPPSYTAGVLTYDAQEGTVSSIISGTANLGSNTIELWVDGNKHQERNTDGPLVYTFSTTPYNTTLGPFNFEVKLTGGSATQTLNQSHNTGADPNASQPPPTQQTSVSLAPAKGGRKRRFPIISTQLFNRQRSVYSIGTTHHEIAPQF